MDFRATEKNNLQNEIKTLNATLKRLEQSQSSLRTNSIIADKEYISVQLKKNDEEITQINDRINEINERLEKVVSGDLDEELEKNVKNNMKIIRKKLDIAEKKRSDKESDDKKNKQKAEKYFKMQKEIDCHRRANEYEMQRSYDWFVKASNELPNYMKENLKTMPNNKGYIWKGISFYGALPKEKNQPRVLFEKKKDNVMMIYETTDKEINVYKKIDKEPKQYVHTILRKKMIY
jgi:hypothetical protein